MDWPSVELRCAVYFLMTKASYKRKLQTSTNPTLILHPTLWTRPSPPASPPPDIQEALAYLGFKPIPSQTLPMQRALCIALECLRRTPRDVDDSLFAVRLYSSIADISIKVTGVYNIFIKFSIKGGTRAADVLRHPSSKAAKLSTDHAIGKTHN